MSIQAGSIIHVGGNNVIDRIQSAGLGDVRVPTEVIREVGNNEIVDKVPGDADFTFTLESFDVSTELEAWLTGKQATGTGSGQGAGDTDAAGTAYDWADCGFLNITSPWKDPSTGSAGIVEAGHLVPGYYARRITYRYGVTDNGTEEVELAGGSYYYAQGSPREQFETGNNSTQDFATDDAAIAHRIGGVEGSSFRRVFGVIVDGELQTRDVDYTESSPANDSDAVATVHFIAAPGTGADIRFTYFAPVSEGDSFPDTVHASTVVKPGAVRGRNICVYLGSGSSRAKLGGIQAFELEATVDGEVEREFCNIEIVGLTINGRDCNGTVTVRAKNKDAFFDVVAKTTGVDENEVIGFLNTHEIPLEVEIQNPKNPSQILKTLYVDDAIFDVPGTPAKVNSPTDFAMRFESRSGTYTAYKGAKP